LAALIMGLPAFDRLQTHDITIGRGRLPFDRTNVERLPVSI
jgi:hypothetical protein